MRALFFVTADEWWGGARAFRAAADAFAAKGSQVSFACAAGSVVEQRLAASPFPVVPVQVGGSRVTESFRLKQALLDHFVEVVFVHTEREQLVASGAARLAERGAVVRRVAAGEKLTIDRRVRTAMRTTPTGYLFTTEPAERHVEGAIESVVADLGVPAERLDEITPIAKEELSPGAERLLTCLYAPGERRQVALVLRAVSLLAPRHPGLRLVLVGRGSDAEEIRMHAAALGITGLVLHLGERDDYLSILRASDLAWVIGERDDAAYGYLDAMGMRVPALAERGDLSERYIADGITGALLPPGDAPATAARLATLLAHEEWRTAMGNAGHSRVARDFPEQAMAMGFARIALLARERTRVART